MARIGRKFSPARMHCERCNVAGTAILVSDLPQRHPLYEDGVIWAMPEGWGITRHSWSCAACEPYTQAPLMYVVRGG